jgi:nucleoid-associated protein YgaU
MRLKQISVILMAAMLAACSSNSSEVLPTEKVTVEKGVSLTKLARQNYDNIYCWVYIYLANKDRITSPNAIPNGTELLIPELTEEELHITKEESIALYGLRHLR